MPRIVNGETHGYGNGRSFWNGNGKTLRINGYARYRGLYPTGFPNVLAVAGAVSGGLAVQIRGIRVERFCRCR